MKISIFKFMAEYYGIILDAGMILTHVEAKKIFKDLKGCPFDYAYSNPELIETGKIIYVSDSVGKILPYVCPEKIETSYDDFMYTERCKKKKEFDKRDLDNLRNLPTYRVHELLSIYKEFPAIYRLIKRELISRGEYENKIHKLEKEIFSLEEEGYNDKYKRRCKIKCKKS